MKPEPAGKCNGMMRMNNFSTIDQDAWTSIKMSPAQYAHPCRRATRGTLLGAGDGQVPLLLKQLSSYRWHRRLEQLDLLKQDDTGISKRVNVGSKRLPRIRIEGNYVHP